MELESWSQLKRTKISKRHIIKIKFCTKKKSYKKKKKQTEKHSPALQACTAQPCIQYLQ